MRKELPPEPFDSQWQRQNAHKDRFLFSIIYKRRVKFLMFYVTGHKKSERSNLEKQLLTPLHANPICQEFTISYILQ